MFGWWLAWLVGECMGWLVSWSVVRSVGGPISQSWVGWLVDGCLVDSLVG